MDVPERRIMIDGQLKTNPAYLAYRNAQYAAEPVRAERCSEEPKSRSAPRKLSAAERVVAWREANPEKVQAQRNRAAVKAAARKAERTALLAVPAGTACDVCGVIDGVQKDTRRGGALCVECKPAVGIVWAVQRAVQYREAIERYLTRTMLA